MKTRELEWQNGSPTPRSVLDCGAAAPLSLRRKTCFGVGIEFRRRFAHAPKSAGAPAQSKTWRAFAAALCLLAAPLFSHAQSYSVDWFTIDDGGGSSTGGVYSLSGTIGQPEANAEPLIGGNFALLGGFWSLLAVPTPGAPLLTIRLTTTNTAIVSWPSPSPGFTLQQNSDLSATNWIAAPQPVTDNGTNKFILVDPPTGNRFYRLFKP